MNNLEKEIDAEVFGKESIVLPERVVKAAASVAMKWIEKAYHKGCRQNYFIEESYQKWLKDSGLTPTEHPKQKEADQGIGNWQKCPLCIGSGEILAIGFIDSVYVRCPTCDGKKIISTLTGQPPTEPDTKEPGKVIPTDRKVDATND